ncbi:MAG: hypothetical protein EBZ69_10530 [Alphaproteobacteria bacterium]|nr:hypothetical protein [Alphaproteobacteria bacterium]
MRGDSDIIQKLNGILTNELTAINQYFLHARLLQHDGLNRLGQKVYQESLGEMKHADIFECDVHGFLFDMFQQPRAVGNRSPFTGILQSQIKGFHHVGVF